MQMAGLQKSKMLRGNKTSHANKEADTRCLIPLRPSAHHLGILLGITYVFLSMSSPLGPKCVE